MLFLKEHPDVIKLDFRVFKAHVYDVPTFTEYLVTNNCNIRAIAMNRNIPTEAQEKLSHAMKVRSDLSVQYYFD